MERQEVGIAMPELGSKKYKQNVREIEEAVSRLNGFTLNLEAKVANMLKGQET
jgi:exonuclease VII small subunit